MKITNSTGEEFTHFEVSHKETLFNREQVERVLFAIDCGGDGYEDEDEDEDEDVIHALHPQEGYVRAERTDNGMWRMTVATPYDDNRREKRIGQKWVKNALYNAFWLVKENDYKYRMFAAGDYSRDWKVVEGTRHFYIAAWVEGAGWLSPDVSVPVSLDIDQFELYDGSHAWSATDRPSADVLRLLIRTVCEIARKVYLEEALTLDELEKYDGALHALPLIARRFAGDAITKAHHRMEPLREMSAVDKRAHDAAAVNGNEDAGDPPPSFEAAEAFIERHGLSVGDEWKSVPGPRAKARLVRVSDEVGQRAQSPGAMRMSYVTSLHDGPTVLRHGCATFLVWDGSPDWSK